MFTVALIATLIAVGAVALPMLLKPEGFSRSIGFLAFLFVVDLVFNLLFVYFATPAQFGPLGGYQWVLVTIAINTALAAVRGSSDEDLAPSYIGPIVVFVGVLIVVLFIHAGSTWFDGNAKALASYPTIKVSESAYPETDPAHIVMVSIEVARFKGGQVIGAGGDNLGSVYHPEDYNLMSVAGHLYYVAPLVYNNIWANLTNFELPGFVVVDAEDPNAQAMLKLDYKLHYVPAAIFSQDLVRHIYLSGYTNYKLVDPTLELDDSWRPYFTVALGKYVRGFTGTRVEAVILVDSESGEILRYSLADTPEWVDRVIPREVAEEYARWWGLWNSASWVNLSKKNTQKPADDRAEIAYSRADQAPVWQIPMTSRSTADNSSTSILLFDTRRNEATLYKVGGIAIGEDVVHAFEANPANLQHYNATSIVLHGIYGEPTWVATFVSESKNNFSVDLPRGSFQAFGLLNAKTVLGSDVIMATTKEEALRKYQRWIADHGSNTVDPTDVTFIKEIEGFVIRIQSEVQSGNTVYSLIVSDMNGNLVDRIFSAESTVSDKLPLTRDGDHIAIQYREVGERKAAIVQFNNFDIGISAPDSTTPVPTSTPLPTATPTSTPASLFESTSVP